MRTINLHYKCFHSYCIRNITLAFVTRDTLPCFLGHLCLNAVKVHTLQKSSWIAWESRALACTLCDHCTPLYESRLLLSSAKVVHNDVLKTILCVALYLHYEWNRIFPILKNHLYFSWYKIQYWCSENGMISMLINAILCYRSHTDLHMTLWFDFYECLT